MAFARGRDATRRERVEWKHNEFVSFAYHMEIELSVCTAIYAPFN